jgi:hypothetical protein
MREGCQRQLHSDIDHLQPGFTFLLLERVNPEKNENRFYYLTYPKGSAPTASGDGDYHLFGEQRHDRTGIADRRP